MTHHLGSLCNVSQLWKFLRSWTQKCNIKKVFILDHSGQALVHLTELIHLEKLHIPPCLALCTPLLVTHTLPSTLPSSTFLCPIKSLTAFGCHCHNNWHREVERWRDRLKLGCQSTHQWPCVCVCVFMCSLKSVTLLFVGFHCINNYIE